MEATSSERIAFPPPSAPNDGASSAPAATELRAAFDSAGAGLVGIEDEVLLLDPDTLELVPEGPRALERLGGDPRFKLELPASQLEIVTPPVARVADVSAALLEGRRALADAVGGFARPAAAGVHPFSSAVGRLNRGERYQPTIDEFGGVAARQLVCALQVHVGVGDADRALAVYNVSRGYLPLIAALAANAPFYEGVDSGLASVRPKICELLPRQGVPPVIESWERYAEILAWGAASGAFPSARTWWWELRLHPSYGTLEFRVPDAQATVADASAVAAVVQALVIHLSDRSEAGELGQIADTWRIEENRWSACRHGVDGTMADLLTGARRPTRECLTELLSDLAPVAERLGSSAELARAHELVSANGAIAQRRAAEDGGARAAAEWLAERFSDAPRG